MPFLAVLICLTLPLAALADTITLKNGDKAQGVIQRIENGRVTMKAGAESRTFEMTEVEQIDFDTPHLTEGTDQLPLEHFRGDVSAQEMARLSQELNTSKKELRAMLDRIKAEWRDRRAVGPDQKQQWEAEKERFQAPLAQYRDVLQDVYLHVLANVDDYNAIAGEAHDLYVGVRGVFNVGSPLVPDDGRELPAKQFVPKSWYDQIYFEGYRDGFKKAREYESLTPR